MKRILVCGFAGTLVHCDVKVSNSSVTSCKLVVNWSFRSFGGYYRLLLAAVPHRNKYWLEFSGEFRHFL